MANAGLFIDLIEFSYNKLVPKSSPWLQGRKHHPEGNVQGTRYKVLSTQKETAMVHDTLYWGKGTMRTQAVVS